MKQEHIEYLSEKLAPYLNDETLSEYLSKGLSEKRYRWDATYKAGLSPWICSNLYPYLNDQHIDTALRYISNTK